MGKSLRTLASLLMMTLLLSAMPLRVPVAAAAAPALNSGQQGPVPTRKSPKGPAYVPGQVLVAFKDGVSEDQKGRSIAAVGGKKLRATKKGTHQVQVQGDVMDTISRLQSDPNVRAVSPNFIRKATALPNDPHLSDQWAVQRVGAPAAWNQLPQASDNVVRVAVLDTGVDLTHPDLAGRILTDEARNFTVPGSPTTDAQDGNGHGTHVAGTIAAQADNAIGVSGIAGSANVKIMPIKILDDTGAGTLYSEVDALEYLSALPENRRPAIVNMSFAAVLSYTDIEAQAIADAADAGILLLAAAGNESADVWMSTPASLPGVLTVAAIDQEGASGRSYTLSDPPHDVPAWFSNWGAEVDLAAPGTNILAPMGQGQIWSVLQASPESDRLLDEGANGTYAYLDGTSMATPVAVGVAALIKAFHPEYSRHQLMAHLLGTLSPAQNGANIQQGWDRSFGYGIASAAHAADTLSPDMFSQWALKVENPGNGRSVKGVINVAVDVDPEIESVQVAVDSPAVTPAIRWSHRPNGQIWNGYLDTTRLTDGSHTLTFTAISQGAVVSQATSTVVVNNGAPVTGLRVEVQTPDGQPAGGWNVSVLQRGSDGQYNQITNSMTDANGQLLLTGAWATDGREYEVIAGGFWYDRIRGRNYGVQYHQTAVAPGVVVMNGDRVRPVRITAVDQAGNSMRGPVFAVPLDKNGKGVVSDWGPAASVSWIDPAMGNPTADLLLEPGRYNLAFLSGPQSGSATNAYLTRIAQAIGDGDLASPPLDLAFSLNDATQVIYQPQYPATVTVGATDYPVSSMIAVQPEDGTYLAGVYGLNPGESLWVSKGRYTPFVAEMVTSDDGYFYFMRGQSTDWTAGGTVALTVGNLTQPTVSLSAAAAAPGQSLAVKAPLVTDRGYTLLLAFAARAGGNPVSLSGKHLIAVSNDHFQRFVPSAGQAGPWLVRTLETSQSSVAQYTDPTPPGEQPVHYSTPYVKVTSNVDGSVLYWNDQASWSETRFTLPPTGVPGPYTVETGVIGLGPIWPFSDQVKATAPFALGGAISAGMRVRVVEPDGHPGYSEVVLYRKVTSGSQTVYAEVDRQSTDLFGGAFFNTNEAGDYVALAYPVSDGAGRRNYLLQGVPKLKTEVVLDGRTAVPFQLSVQRPNPAGGPTAPMMGAALFATALDSKGVPIDSPWIRNSSCAAGPCNPGGVPDANPIPPEFEPAGTRLVWLTPGDYKFAAVDAFDTFQLASPDKVTVKAGVTGYSFPTGVGKLTINPPHYDFQSSGVDLGWRSFIRPAGTYVDSYWSPAIPQQPLSVWVTPGTHEVWTEWVHAATPDQRRQWAYIASTPALSVPAYNAARKNDRTVSYGGAFDANLSGTTVKSGTVSGQLSVTDQYGNLLRSVALSDNTAPGELLAATAAHPGVPAAGRLAGASRLMREVQVAALLRSAPGIKLVTGYNWPFWGDRLTPALQVTDPLYQVTGQNSTDPLQWYSFTYAPPKGAPAGTYSVRLTVPLSDSGPAVSDPVTVSVAGTGAGNLKLSRRHFTPGGPNGLTIMYNPVAAGTVAFTVVDSNGKPVSTLGAQTVKLGDSLTLTWDGTDSTKKRTVPNGDYKVVATMGKAWVSQPVTVSVLDVGQAWVVGSPLVKDGDPVTVAIVPDQPGDVAVTVVDANDQPVADLGTTKLLPVMDVAGYQPTLTETWDGLGPDGKFVDPGTYSFKLTDTNNPDLVAYLDFDVRAASGTLGATEPYLLPWYSVDGSDFAFTYQGAPGAITAAVVDLNGSVLTSVNKTVPALAAGQTTSSVRLTWNGIVNGKVAAPGVYRLKVSRTGAADVYTDFGINPFSIGNLSLSPFTPSAAGAAPFLTVSLDTPAITKLGTAAAAYTAKIQTAAGTDVATLTASPAGSTTWTWNGKATNGSYAPDGNYQVLISNSLVPKSPLVVPFTVAGVSVPAPAVTPVPPYVTSNTLTVSGTALPGSQLAFLLDGKSLASTVTADGSGNWSAVLSGLTAGAHKLQARQTAAGTGFTGPLSPTVTFTVDTAKPALSLTAPLKAGAVNYVANGNFTIQGTASDAMIPVTLTLSDGVTRTVLTVSSDKGSKGFKFPAKLADGSYDALLTAVDPAGNASDPLTFTIIVDTRAPAVTAVDLTPAGGAPVDPADIAYDAQGRISTVKYLLKTAGPYSFSATFSEMPLGLKVNGTAAAVDANSLTASANITVPNAGLSFKIEGKDAAGNALLVTVTVGVDGVAPTFTPAGAVPTVSAATLGKPAALTFTASEAIRLDTVEVYGCDVTAGTCTGPFAVTPVKVSYSAARRQLTVQVPTDSLSDGRYVYAVRAADATGNEIGTDALSWSQPITVDTTPPTVTITSAAPSSAIYTLTAAIHDDGGIAKITVTAKAGTVTLSNRTITVGGNADYALTQKLNLGAGPVTIYITVTDKAGNTGMAQLAR